MSDIPLSLREEVVLRARNRCEYCQLSQIGQVAAFHIDHVVPRAAAGPTTSDNLALACVSCSLLDDDSVDVHLIRLLLRDGHAVEIPADVGLVGSSVVGPSANYVVRHGSVAAGQRRWAGSPRGSSSRPRYARWRGGAGPPRSMDSLLGSWCLPVTRNRRRRRQNNRRQRPPRFPRRPRQGVTSALWRVRLATAFAPVGPGGADVAKLEWIGL
jgi:hypothetical protein